MQGPSTRYQHLVETGQLTPDPAQAQLIAILQTLHDQIVARRPGLLAKWRKSKPISGLYVHGDVGRGKTMMMDLLASSLAAAGVAAWRIHFHRFMDHVHDRLKRLGQRRDPLKSVAAEIADRASVLCFDEFHVSDIGDAMILAELLDQLLARGVLLVATSNTPPADLYADGLQRARFLPAIELIEQHCRVVALEATTDYRLRELERHPVYYCPNDKAARSQLAAEFQALAAGEEISSSALAIRGRRLTPLRRAGSTVWFDFDTLCRGHRATGDYIELARRFSTLIVSDIPVLAEEDNDATRRLIHLVDECYDRAVKLIVSAAAPPERLYDGKRLRAPFQRTVSRLIEMQSQDYLQRPHQP